jgi:thiamine biosynthesis lipoprotein
MALIKRAPWSFTVLSLFCWGLCLGCQSLSKDKKEDSLLCERSQKLPSMGSLFEVQITTACQSLAPYEVFIQIQKKLDQIESEMSLYQTDSPINRLNRDSVLQGSFPHLNSVLKFSIENGRRTEGAFTVTVLPLLQLVQSSFEKNNRPPTEGQLQSLRAFLDDEKIAVTESKIQFSKPGLKVTLDGVAKGYAVDVIAKILQDEGYANFLLNFSGNMRWQGVRPDRQARKISIWNPILKNGLPLDLSLQGAIASSGPEVNFYSEDKLWHHLIDPKTLRPARLWAQTTVVGESAQLCDLLSTASFMLSEEKIAEVFQANYSQYQVWVVDLKGQQRKVFPRSSNP